MSCCTSPQDTPAVLIGDYIYVSTETQQTLKSTVVSCARGSFTFKICHGYKCSSWLRYFQLELLPLLTASFVVEFYPKAAIKSGARDRRWNDKAPCGTTGSLREVSPPSDHRWRFFFFVRFILCARMAVGRMLKASRKDGKRIWLCKVHLAVFHKFALTRNKIKNRHFISRLLALNLFLYIT